MKKILQLVILLSAVQLSARGFAPIHGTHSGIISGVNFTPLQISIFPSEKTQLFDEAAYTIFSVGLLAVYQQFSIISVAPLCGVNNYFLQVAVLCNLDGDSRGIALAPVNAHNKNYGLQTGLLNWSGDKKLGMQTGIYNENGLFQLGILNYDGLLQIGFYNEGYYFLYDSLEKATEKEKNTIGFQLGLLNNCDNACVQIGAINGGDGEIQLGLVNVNRKDGVQIGVFNASDNGCVVDRKTSIQFGLLNYNPRSYIPWLPFVNWDMEVTSNDSDK